MSEYVPTTDEVRAAFVWVYTRNFDGYQAGLTLTSEQKRYGGEFDCWLAAHDARVRRDTLTALADHWDETVSEHAGRPLFSASGTHVRYYRDTHYPEVTP